MIEGFIGLPCYIMLGASLSCRTIRTARFIVLPAFVARRGVPAKLPSLLGNIDAPRHTYNIDELNHKMF